MNERDFKVGDKVRYKYEMEGVAEVHRSMGRLYIDTDGSLLDDGNPWLDTPGLTLELIPEPIELPTEAGAIVQQLPSPGQTVTDGFILGGFRQGRVYDPDVWWDVRGSKWYTAEYVSEWCRTHPHRIIPAPSQSEVA